MAQTRQAPPVVSVKSETARKKQLLKQPRNQFFLASKTEEKDAEGEYQTTKIILRFDLDPLETSSPLSRLVRVDTRKPNGGYISESFKIVFDNEQQIIDIKDDLHRHSIYSAVSLLEKLNPANNLSIQKIIEHLLTFWQEQITSSPYLFIHEVKCLADNITCFKYEEMWTLSGLHGSPELLMSDNFSYEGIQQAIQAKHERQIFEKGCEEGRRSALKDFNLFPIKRVDKHERSKSEERSCSSAKRRHF